MKITSVLVFFTNTRYSILNEGGYGVVTNQKCNRLTNQNIYLY